MPALLQSPIGGIIAIGLLAAIANAVLAWRGQGRADATAFSIAFASIAVTGALSILWPSDSAAVYRVLAISLFAAISLTGMWAGLSLRAGHRPNGWVLASLVIVWMTPFFAWPLLGWESGASLPACGFAIVLALLSSIWKLYRKRDLKNAGDWALIILLLLSLPASLSATLAGLTPMRVEAGTIETLYLLFLSALFVGIALFVMLSVTLDALQHSTELAQTDGLTGLLNRRAYEQALQVAAARAERFQRDLSLIVLDVDNFKQLNDDYGHRAGDAVLRAVAQVLLDKSRRIDTVARVGGEEFALILADTHVAAALRLAERLRESLCAASTESIVFSASFGVASVAETKCSAEALHLAAGSALSAAKDAGKNRVRYAKDPSRDSAELIGLV